MCHASHENREGSNGSRSSDNRASSSRRSVRACAPSKKASRVTMCPDGAITTTHYSRRTMHRARHRATRAPKPRRGSRCGEAPHAEARGSESASPTPSFRRLSRTRVQSLLGRARTPSDVARGLRGGRPGSPSHAQLRPLVAPGRPGHEAPVPSRRAAVRPRKAAPLCPRSGSRAPSRMSRRRCLVRACSAQKGPAHR